MSAFQKWFLSRLTILRQGSTIKEVKTHWKTRRRSAATRYVFTQRFFKPLSLNCCSCHLCIKLIVKCSACSSKGSRYHEKHHIKQRWVYQISLYITDWWSQSSLFPSLCPYDVTPLINLRFSDQFPFIFNESLCTSDLYWWVTHQRFSLTALHASSSVVFTRSQYRSK